MKERQAGFTLVELIMTMVILGIIAAVAMPRFFDTNVFQERGAADQVRAALRYGQKIAIAQRGAVSVNITAAANSDCGTQLTGGDVACVIEDSVTVVPALPRTVTFNALGQPVPNAAGLIRVGTTDITIEAETGYVH
jgi:MSHA pilin protein MshC